MYVIHLLKHIHMQCESMNVDKIYDTCLYRLYVFMMRNTFVHILFANHTQRTCTLIHFIPLFHRQSSILKYNLLAITKNQLFFLCLLGEGQVGFYWSIWSTKIARNWFHFSVSTFFVFFLSSTHMLWLGLEVTSTDISFYVIGLMEWKASIFYDLILFDFVNFMDFIAVMNATSL